MSLKNPSELFEQRRNQSLANELAQKKKQEELEISNKKIASPKELFGVVEEVEEKIIEEEVGEDVIDPYLEQIELLKDDLQKLVLSIPEETDLTKVFQDIRILGNRIDNLPKQKEYSGDIESIREELVRIEDSIPVPEVFDPSDLYENISVLKTKIEEIRSEIPIIPEPILYDYQLDQLKEMVVDVRNSIPVVPEIRYYEDDLNEIINAIEEVRSEIPKLPEIKYYDDELNILESRLVEIQESIPTVKYYDDELNILNQKIVDVKESIPVVPEIKYYDKDVKELKEEIASVKKSIPEVKYYDEDIQGLNEEVQRLYKKILSIKIPDQDKYIKEVKGLYSSFEEKNHRLLEKINYLEEIFEKFNEETLTEGLLNEPPDVKNSDPLTPLDQNFVTLPQLQEHYRLFISRIQQQLSTLGGGGETRLEFLDDVDRDSAKIPGRFLKYDEETDKWIGALGGAGGSQTLDDTLGLGNTSSLGMSVGVITATYFVGDGSLLTNVPGSGNSGYANTAGIATYATSSGIATYASTAGIATYATSSGIATYTTNAGYSTSAGIATALQYSRTISISGDVVGSTTFDGTQNVSIAATIQPNSVGLGTDTTGDYVQSITGTSNQIVVSVTSGEGSAPTLSIPNQFTIPQDATVTRDLQVNRNLNVTGNITLGGTTAFLNVQELKITDPDIVLGFRTDAFGNDISNDTTANHGGVALASTEGNPLVNLNIAGIETFPATYKKIMWFKAGAFAGLGTDAWLFNYAVGIGSTQFPNGTRLAAGSVQFTENDLAVVRNINSAGVITATTFIGTLSGYASTAGIATYAPNAGVATYATSSGIATSVIGGIASVTQLNVSGITTLGIVTAGNIYSTGIITTTSFSGSGINLTGIVTSIVAGTNVTISGSTGQVTINATGGTGGGSGTNYWEQTSAGINTLSNVGIGTTNPTTTLSVRGNFTATDTRIQNVAEKLTRVDGNTVSLAYNAGGGNIGLCTNPIGDITLNVTGIPTDSSFDNHSITFSVIVTQTGTARSCTAVNLNGVSEPIFWSGGSLATAISGVTTKELGAVKI